MSGAAHTFQSFCPNCKGTIPWSEGSRVALCPFCHRRSMLFTDEEAELRFSLAPVIDESSALTTARHLLTTQKVMTSRQVEAASFEEPTLFFVPFHWRNGTAPSVTEEMGRESHADVVMDTRVTIEDYEAFEPAVTLRGWELEAFDLTTLLARPLAPPIQPYDGTALRARGLVLPPQERPDEAVARMTVRHRSAEPIAERRRLLFAPIWVVPFRADGRRFEVRFDGIDGKLLSARGPEDSRLRVPMALGVMLLPCLLLGKLIRVFFTTSETSPAMLGFVNPGFLLFALIGGLFALFLFLALLAFAWSLLRFEADHLYRGQRLWSEQLGSPGETALDRLTNTTGNALTRLLGGEPTS